ncbi:MAG: NADH-quinone oxidoreductase subunit I [Acidobacteria bacterium]|nr:NADH-quinone oxidoreductase subunit I [Acidobacteriota bacterium]
MATDNTNSGTANGAAPKKNLGFPLKGIFTGMGITLRTLFKRTPTVHYPLVKERPVDRARGVIALDTEACTSCMLCARECPDWCIYIEAHKEDIQPDKPGGRVKTRAKLDRFDIDYALCMYCGICVEVCPFDALFWTPEFEYSELKISDLLHDKDKLTEWLDTVPTPPALEPS